MVLSICHVKHIAVERYSLRIIKLSLSKLAVFPTRFSRAGNCDFFSIKFGDYDSMMGGIGNKEPIRHGIRQHLAGEEKWRVALFSKARQIEADRIAIQCTSFIVFRD